MINLMKEENPQRQTINYIEKHYGSANVIDFLIVKNNNEQLDVDDFNLMSELNKDIATLPFVKSIAGYDLWHPLITKVSGLDPHFAEQLRSGFLTTNRNRSRIMAVIPSGSAKEMDIMLQAIQRKIDAKSKDAKFKVIPVGFLPLFIEQLNSVVDGMLYGLLIAVILIQLVIMLLVREIKLGFLTLIVTVVPLSGIALTMKLFHIPFDVGTSIISSVVIGMIADDAIHLVWNYKRKIKILNIKGETDDNLFANSIRKIVFPCTVTSIMFFCGFIVLIHSNMTTIINFGVLCAVTIVLAWISDFLFLPALINLFYKPRFKKIDE